MFRTALIIRQWVLGKTEGGKTQVKDTCEQAGVILFKIQRYFL